MTGNKKQVSNLQELEYLKIELELKQNYYGAFTSNILSDELLDKIKKKCNCLV